VKTDASRTTEDFAKHVKTDASRTTEDFAKHVKTDASPAPPRISRSM
jgi:hypothetical protein